MASDPSKRGNMAPVTELTPAHPGSGTLRITFTGFPGLLVKLGQESEFALPACGCDACDEDPDELILELREHVDSLTRADQEHRMTRWRRRAGGR